jgi:cytochrome c-type biogenesis protein CcmH
LLVLVALALTPAQAGANVEREARDIETMLIAPCCFMQQVSVHQSPAADEVRRDVRSRLAAGQSRQQILDAYVGRYGKRILAEPPASGFDRLLYAAPVVAFLASIGLIVLVVRRLTARERALTPAEPAAVARGRSPLDATLDDELRDMD